MAIAIKGISRMEDELELGIIITKMGIGTAGS